MKKKNTNYSQKKHNVTNYQNKTTASLPSPAMLESYEEVFPGFTKELMEFIKKEQEQTKEWKNNYLKSVNKIVKFGQFLAFLFSVMVLIVSVYLFKNNSSNLALTLFIAWLIFLVLINLRVGKSK